MRLQAVLFVMPVASYIQKHQEGGALGYFFPTPLILLKSLTWTRT